MARYRSRYSRRRRPVSRRRRGRRGSPGLRRIGYRM